MFQTIDEYVLYRDIISGQARIIRLFEILSGPGALSFLGR